MKRENIKKIFATSLSLMMVVSLLSYKEGSKEVKGDTTNNNFAKLLQESLYFYDANMCGTNVGEKSAFSWRDDCHASDANVTYKGRKVDVSGGFHDAGDHVKFGLPQAYSATMLGLSYYEYENAYKEFGLTKHYKNILNHFVEYFEKCTVLDDNGNVEAFCYQVGNADIDHKYWGKPEEQDVNQGNRVNQVYFTSSDNPATDIVSETAAALAIYYLNFKDEKALNYSKKLFAYAQENNKQAATDGPDNYYESLRIEDDYCMAAIMLYKATKDNNYSNEFKKYSGSCNEWSWLSWDDVSVLALYYGNKDGLYSNPYGNPLSNCLNSMKEKSSVVNGYYCLDKWGSTRYNCNMDLMSLMLGGESNVKWALGQLEYIAGDDSRSFVIGHTNFELHPHYRASSGYGDVNSNAYTKHAHLLVGALVGGPDKEGNFINDASNYQYTEVAIDYNAGFVFVCAGAVSYMMSIGNNNQITVDDSTLSNEFRSSVMNEYKTEAANARGGEAESSIEETEEETEKVTEIETEIETETDKETDNETGKETEIETDTATSNNELESPSESSSVNSSKNTVKPENKNENKSNKKDTIKKNTGKIRVNIKNKKKYKKTKKIIIKSKLAIKSIRINNKIIKYKKNKKIVKFKLRKYKKYLKRRKMNKIIIIDINGTKLIRRFKIK